ncbi:MAG TPA: hypothetical protein VMM13_17135 [Euzebya sp.]|nr:hypothetical protein [Euzebya sp.]
MSEPRGAGNAGGLLFIAVMLVLGYLVISAVAGFLKWLIGVAFVVVIIAMIVRVLSRR